LIKPSRAIFANALCLAKLTKITFITSRGTFDRCCFPQCTLLALGGIFVVAVSGKTQRANLASSTKPPRPARDTFGTAAFGRPPDGAIDTRSVSSFAAVIRVFSTRFTSSSTENVLEFTGTAFRTRSLSLVTLTKPNGAFCTGRRVHATGTKSTRWTGTTRTVHTNACLTRTALGAFSTALYRLCTSDTVSAKRGIGTVARRVGGAWTAQRLPRQHLKFAGQAWQAVGGIWLGLVKTFWALGARGIGIARTELPGTTYFAPRTNQLLSGGTRVAHTAPHCRKFSNSAIEAV
jgi:hypothetical protein